MRNCGAAASGQTTRGSPPAPPMTKGISPMVGLIPAVALGARPGTENRWIAPEHHSRGLCIEPPSSQAENSAKTCLGCRCVLALPWGDFDLNITAWVARSPKYRGQSLGQPAVQATHQFRLGGLRHGGGLRGRVSSLPQGPLPQPTMVMAEPEGRVLQSDSRGPRDKLAAVWTPGPLPKT